MNAPNIATGRSRRRSLALLTGQLRGFTHVLILGGTPAWRAREAARCHDDSLLRRGPFAALGPGDEAMLRGAIDARLLCGARPVADDPLRASEGGSLYLDDVRGLSHATQRALLALIDHSNPAADLASPVWVGRIIAGSSFELLNDAHSGRFLDLLYDTLDKVRIEYPTSRRGGCR